MNVRIAFPGTWVALVLMLTACATTGVSQKKQEAESGPQIVEDIVLNYFPDKTQVEIVTKNPAIYTAFRLTNPERVIVDLAGMTFDSSIERMDLDEGVLMSIQPIEGEEPSYVARLELTLSQEVESNVQIEGNHLIIDIIHPEADESERFEEPVIVEEPLVAVEPEMSTEPLSVSTEEFLLPAKVIDHLDIDLNESELTVSISGDGELVPEIFMVGEDRLVIDLPEVTNTVTPNVFPVSHPLVNRIRVGQHADPMKVRVVLDLAGSIDFDYEAEGESVILSIRPASFPVEEAAVMAPMEPVEEPVMVDMPIEEPPVEEPVMVDMPVEEPMVEEPVVEEAKVEKELPAVVEEKVVPPPKPQVPDSPPPIIEAKRYIGRPISLDFQDADLTSVLRLMADVSELNIIIGPGVKGRTTVKLMSVPWDQALDVILKMHTLGQIREGNIIEIDTLENIVQQRAQEAAAKEAAVKAENLVTKIIPINYAEAGILSKSLEKNLSPRGTITIDERTNTMIVNDIEQNLDTIVEMSRRLDTPTPQVLIEARIVQADRSFAKSLGIMWGASLSTISGNNIFALNTGTAGDFNAQTPGFAVNLPATVGGLPEGNTPGVGFSFGRFTDSPFNLDLRISAAELSSTAKTISSPRIITLDNKEAIIEQGEKIPYQTTSQQGTQTTFIDANLTLKVTPHVTADKRILLKVMAARNAIGSLSTPAGPSIAKREATTEILLKNNETTVIGGIFLDEKKNSETGIPFLSKIPVLGWLFKNKSETTVVNELLIFITPTIVTDP